MKVKSKSELKEEIEESIKTNNELHEKLIKKEKEVDFLGEYINNLECVLSEVESEKIILAEKLLKANMEYKEQVTQINRLVKKNEEVNSRNEKLKAFIIITTLISILYWMW